MYFPYLRGKQHELAAVLELSSLLLTSKKIVPVIEPVNRDHKKLEKNIAELNKSLIPYVLILNPIEGDLKGTIIDLTVHTKLTPHKAASVGYIIHSGTTLGDVETFLNLHKAYNISFIHFYDFGSVAGLIGLMQKHKNVTHQIFIEIEVSAVYRNAFKTYQRVLIRDGFRKATKNALFPPDEFFSDLHLNYKKDGYHGFGDFATIGRVFQTGGIAHAVAIHLTYFDNPKGALRIRHFVSDRTETNLDIPGKFHEALEKLIKFLTHSSVMPICPACSKFQILYTTGHYPGLGTAKKLSIKHHLETMVLLI